MRLPRFAGLRQRLTYANVMATVALFFALTGSAMAVGKYILTTDTISTGDLAGSTYGNPLITDGKVTTAKIADGAVTSAKFNSAAKAPDADKLDGIDSTAFVSGYELVSEGQTGGNPGDTQFTFISHCPPGKIVLGGGTDAIVFNPSTFDTVEGNVMTSYPWQRGPGPPDAWLSTITKADRSPLAPGQLFSIGNHFICAKVGS